MSDPVGKITPWLALCQMLASPSRTESPSTKRWNQRRRNEHLASKEASPHPEKTLNADDRPYEPVLEPKTTEGEQIWTLLHLVTYVDTKQRQRME